MRLSIAIQHHPSRPHLPDRLLSRLDYVTGRDDGMVEIVTDPDPDAAPSPWRTARLAWQTTPAWCTHRLVIQDDALPCARFLDRLATAVDEMPDAPLALFFGVNSYALGLRAYCDAHSAGDALYPLPHVGWVPCVALVLPRDQALDLGSFWNPNHDRASVADDEVVMEWCAARGLTAYATCPSLVQHDDGAESLMGTGGRVRSAVCFRDDCTYPPRQTA